MRKARLSILKRIFGGKSEREDVRALYDRVVAYGRDPAWYREGQVPDSLDGRFDMIAAVLALVLVRLERDEEAARASVLLAELFIEDMDGSIRQMGIGDLMVGKHVGNMMGALGGRLTAFREAVGAAGAGLDGPVSRNIFHDAPPSPEATRFVSGRLEDFYRNMERQPVSDILRGALPAK